MTVIRRLRHDETGATAIEYGLIAALIAIGLVVAMDNLGGEVNETFVELDGELDEANKGVPPTAD